MNNNNGSGLNSGHVRQDYAINQPPSGFGRQPPNFVGQSNSPSDPGLVGYPGSDPRQLHMVSNLNRPPQGQLPVGLNAVPQMPHMMRRPAVPLLPHQTQGYSGYSYQPQMMDPNQQAYAQYARQTQLSPSPQRPMTPPLPNMYPPTYQQQEQTTQQIPRYQLPTQPHLQSHFPNILPQIPQNQRQINYYPPILPQNYQIPPRAYQPPALPVEHTYSHPPQSLLQQIHVHSNSNPTVQSNATSAAEAEEVEKRQLIITNLKDDVTETELRTFFSSPPLEDLRFVSPPKGRCFVVLRFVSPALDEVLAADKSGVFIRRYSDELYRRLTNERDETQAKQTAARLENPANLTRLLCEPTDFLKTFHDILSKRSLSFYANTIRVREIWIGNLPKESTKESVRQALSIFGTVDECDLFSKEQVFAFVKFQLVDQASACVDQQNILIPKLGPVKVNYSDFLKRYNIVGDRANVREFDSKTTNIVFLGAANGGELPKEAAVRANLEPLGTVVNVLSRPSLHETHRGFMLIEMATKDQARRVRAHYALEDRDAKRKTKLGDKRYELNLLAKPNVQGSISDYISPYLSLSPSQPLANGSSDQDGQQGKQTSKSSNSQPHIDWTGFLTKNNNMLTGIDAFVIHGNSHDLFEESFFNLNITNKADYSDLKNAKIEGIIRLVPSNETYRELFQEHVAYLSEKGVLGWVRHLSQYNLYISAEPHLLPIQVPEVEGRGELVGVYIKKIAEEWTDG